jgi:hypothetical protein
MPASISKLTRFNFLLLSKSYLELSLILLGIILFFKKLTLLKGIVMSFFGFFSKLFGNSSTKDSVASNEPQKSGFETGLDAMHLVLSVFVESIDDEWEEIYVGLQVKDSRMTCDFCYLKAHKLYPLTMGLLKSTTKKEYKNAKKDLEWVLDAIHKAALFMHACREEEGNPIKPHSVLEFSKTDTSINFIESDSPEGMSVDVEDLYTSFSFFEDTAELGLSVPD